MSYILRSPEITDKELEKYPELTRLLLLARGIKTVKEAEEFLQPDYKRDLHDPFLFNDMVVAVKRIFGAIARNEKILIYSDYDADGVPGGAILHDFFKKISYENFFNYIPNRESEGFGLNTEAVDDFAKQGVKLVITVDCGVVDLAEAEALSNHQIDLIITDHHLPIRQLAEGKDSVGTARCGNHRSDL
jgi:single-stranded-DNA-specific exonuclease